MYLIRDGSYVCRVYAAELPSTAAATPPAAAEEAKSKHFKSPTCLTIIIYHHASNGFLTCKTKRIFPQLTRVFNLPDKE
jgi:hypothetical protein